MLMIFIIYSFHFFRFIYAVLYKEHLSNLSAAMKLTPGLRHLKFEKFQEKMHTL